MTSFEYRTQVISHMDYINRFAFRYTNDSDKAQDLAQETILKALANYDKFRTNTNLKGWMKVIMKNTFINSYRKKGNYMVTYDSDGYHATYGLPDTYLPDNMMMAEQIQKLIDDLEEGLRAAFMMHYQGFKYHEIAKKLDLPMGTVKSRIHQARKVLASQIQND